MKTLGLSRGTAIDTDLCVQNAGGNRYDLVILAAARAKDIRRQHKESQKREHVFPNLTSLLEIQEGKWNKDYLKRIK
jgi:DNA-directed RNA polymerase omega subunit